MNIIDLKNASVYIAETNMRIGRVVNATDNTITVEYKNTTQETFNHVDGNDMYEWQNDNSIESFDFEIDGTRISYKSIEV